MSDQDFFFEDEPQAPKPSGKGSKSAAAPAAPKPRAPKAPAATASTPVTGASDPLAFADQSTTWAVASLVCVCGLLLGLILGFALGTTLAKNAATAALPTPAVTATTPSTVSGGASTLTTAQLASGELPAGHPVVNIPATGSATATK
ncbi:MAG TPA: hypothetical protein VIK83_00220 [Coriobacteriia bacterium]